MVMTSEKGAEVESLNLGASDFLTKPYSQPEVVMARVLKTIELSEDREIIQSTERDPLTGLYNREFFFSYAEQYDQYHKEKEMDAIVVDINHFHMINERYGKEYGDVLLKTIGERLREKVQDNGGIVCRRSADTFLVYCPHGKDFKEILDHASEGLGEDMQENSKGRVRLRMGVYPSCDKKLNIERRFDRAKLAADRIRSDFTASIAFYDKTLHDAQIYSEQLIDDFPRAIKNKEFQVYYQPKFDIRTDTPVLAGAEALVRWIHPELGFINPGVFIPLFEENGLIQQLDYYVWEAAAAQMKEWKERYEFSLIVSVNISRIDMYDPLLVDKLNGLVEKYGLTAKDYALEITESAYTEDSEQIIEQVNVLRSKGFRIEMDDFGTGYSSLNMISKLPIDVLKIDMLFIRAAFGDRQDMRMLELIMDIADYLDVPVIAEGVETEDQVEALRKLGCDYAQGFYFSKPVTTEEYDVFLEERKKHLDEQTKSLENESELYKHLLEDEKHRHISYSRIAQALAQDYFSIYYVDIVTDEYIEYSSSEEYKELQLEQSGRNFFEETRQNIERVIFEADRELAFNVWKKENILNGLEDATSYSATYRIMMNEEPIFINAKAIRLRRDDSRHIVVGISNVDAQMQREQELVKAQELILKDALTGVKNKLAYIQTEKQVDAEIASGKAAGMALVVCDLNDLKEINDTKGHSAGDQCLVEACRIICNTFKHSPVFRVGGDEFVVLMRGQDYDNRLDLLRQMDETNQKNAAEQKVTIACGIAEFVPGEDDTLEAVFDRADHEMYKNKRTGKAADREGLTD